jgi:L-fucose mutarotase/ribose pyranase (RbsD/FucU family)
MVKETIVACLKKPLVYVSILLFVFVCGCQSRGWQGRLDTVLPEYGHRNWIVVVDSAYPKQSAPGIETLYTGKTQIEVLETVLDAVDAAPHVQAVVMLDAELDSVAEADAPGVTAYRAQLREALQGKQVKTMPHEDIIGELDKGAEMFNVLVLKSDMILPYTSVFIQLDCGYWNADKEQRLRDALAK